MDKYSTYDVVFGDLRFRAVRGITTHSLLRREHL